MWKSLYDGLLQWATMPWSEYLQSERTCGRNVQNNFYSSIYSWIGLELIMVSIIMAVIYYYYLNYRFGKYYSVKSWVVMMSVNCIIVAILTYVTTNNILDNPVCSVSTHLMWITIINFLYAAVLFFFISMLIKWQSPMAKRTPL